MKSILCLLVWGLTLATNVSPAAPADFPKKPIRIIVPVAGGTGATVARLLGQEFTRAWGKPVVIFPLPGAGASIAADRVAKAEPDGYTLGLLPENGLLVRPVLYKVGYDPVKDFAPVSQVTMQPLVLVVNNGIAARSVEELVKLAKARPGELTYGINSSGTAPHIAGELLKSRAGIDIRHIPYKTGALAIPDLLSGRVAMLIYAQAPLLRMVRDGKMRAIAVTSPQRSRAIPDIPTLAESGYPGFDVTVWYGLLAPAQTPRAIVSKVHGETVRALKLPDLRARLNSIGLEAIGNSPEEFAEIIKSGLAKWAKVIRASGIKPD